MQVVRLAVKVNGKQGRAFKTNIGTPQGDCLSPILFNPYLGKALRKDAEMKKKRQTEEENTRTWHLM